MALPSISLDVLDELTRASLESFRDSWFGVLIWSTILVGVGVLLEGPEVFHEIAELYRKCRKLPKRHKRAWVTVASVIGWTLVAIGVIGEGISEGVVFQADTQVQAFNNTLLAAAQKEAGDAAQSAKTAHDEVGAVSKEADAIRDKLNTVGRRADDLSRKYLADERTLAKLRAERVHRRLSSEQKAILRQRVADFSVKTIRLTCTTLGSGAGEALDFEQDFVSTFGTQDSPVSLDGYLVSCNTNIGGQPPPLIEIRVGSGRKGDGEIIFNALAEIGISKDKIRVSPTADNAALLELVIGPKEEPSELP